MTWSWRLWRTSLNVASVVVVPSDRNISSICWRRAFRKTRQSQMPTMATSMARMKQAALRKSSKESTFSVILFKLWELLCSNWTLTYVINPWASAPPNWFPSQWPGGLNIHINRIQSAKWKRHLNLHSTWLIFVEKAGSHFVYFRFRHGGYIQQIPWQLVFLAKQWVKNGSMRHLKSSAFHKVP